MPANGYNLARSGSATSATSAGPQRPGTSGGVKVVLFCALSISRGSPNSASL